MAATWYQVSGDVRLAEPLAVAGAVLVLEAPADGAPRRLLRLAAAGAAPTVLAAGYFAEGTLRASPDGKAVAAVWHESLAAVQRREAGLRWIGPGWAGLPGELPRVTGFAWSPDGRRLAVGRHEAGRDWVELYPAGAGAAAEILGSSPQWWSSR
ncbi:MAG: hypothetical protein B9S34_15220 [Opitutia bacterium Tous-C1TDCM]|nr:MAG: hypothetical protein B9S34_15220 [Opitutae bacterium Tous-C1TDCM]